MASDRVRKPISPRLHYTLHGIQGLWDNLDAALRNAHEERDEQDEEIDQMLYSAALLEEELGWLYALLGTTVEEVRAEDSADPAVSYTALDSPLTSNENPGVYQFCLDCGETLDTWPDRGEWTVYEFRPVALSYEYEALNRGIPAFDTCNHCGANLHAVYLKREEAQERGVHHIHSNN
jgi:hypothetical protein